MTSFIVGSSRRNSEPWLQRNEAGKARSAYAIVGESRCDERHLARSQIPYTALEPDHRIASLIAEH